MLGFFLFVHLPLAAVSVPFWPSSHRRRWTIIPKALTWEAWLIGVIICYALDGAPGLVIRPFRMVKR